MSAPIESGIGTSAPAFRTTLPPRLSSRPRSSSRRTSSSAKSGLPPARSRISACRSVGRTWPRGGRGPARPSPRRRAGPGRRGWRRPEAGARAGQIHTSGRAVARTKQGDAGAALRQVVHEGQHRLVGPVQVLHDEHGRPGGGRPSRNSRQAAKFSSRRPPRPRGRAGAQAGAQAVASSPSGARSRGALRPAPRRRSPGCRRRP